MARAPHVMPRFCHCPKLISNPLRPGGAELRLETSRNLIALPPPLLKVADA